MYQRRHRASHRTTTNRLLTSTRQYSPGNFKARVAYAKVEQITDTEGNEYKEAKSAVYRGDLGYDGPVYKVGEMVHPDGFDRNISTECGQGINVHMYRDHCDQWFR